MPPSTATERTPSCCRSPCGLCHVAAALCGSMVQCTHNTPTLQPLCMRVHECIRLAAGEPIPFFTDHEALGSLGWYPKGSPVFGLWCEPPGCHAIRPICGTGDVLGNTGAMGAVVCADGCNDARRAAHAIAVPLVLSLSLSRCASMHLAHAHVWAPPCTRAGATTSFALRPLTFSRLPLAPW